MTTTTTTLTDFLLARIAEDEAAARDVHRSDSWHFEDGWRDDRCELVGGGKVLAAFTDEDRMAPLHIARHDPARVLAECAAKRAVLTLHSPYPTPQVMVYGTITACSECGSVDDSPIEWPCPTLRHLAAVYADHSDYDPAWAVS